MAAFRNDVFTVVNCVSVVCPLSPLVICKELKRII